MTKLIRYSTVLAVATCLLLAVPAVAQDGIQGKLVTPKWLEKNLKNADILILDASGAKSYKTNHIPGAVNAPFEVVNFPFALQSISDADLEKMYQATGISNGKRIVVYDAGGDNVATRLFYSLYYRGFPVKDLYYLDGGLSKWKAEGLPVTPEPSPDPRPGNFKFTKVMEDARVALPEFLSASGDPAHSALVEALGPDWHYGQTGPMSKAGHIPNSVLLPGDDFFNPDKTFKSPEEIRKMVAYMGVTPNQQIYTYCGGGVAASVPYFAIKFILNYPKVKLYPESEVGWLSDERELPFWTYDSPSLMRDAKWLQFWDSQMLRMFVGAQISVVDVRPADAFNQGHVPFALNVPAEVFQNNINHPEKLAEILGQAGINPSQEAVVLSGAGLTKESALAFVALERLGQKKVSVLIDPADKWPQPGFAMTKAPTVVGPKKSRNDVSIPPSTYPKTVRNDVVIADTKSTPGVFPKVYIASGQNVPTRSDGKVVHVPYTDLLNTDGTPKAAKDIWTVLTKAGVPRYAQLICISDDPGEAAANYYIFKLMGFPDVKVLGS